MVDENENENENAAGSASSASIEPSHGVAPAQTILDETLSDPALTVDGPDSAPSEEDATGSSSEEEPEPEAQDSDDIEELPDE